MFKQNVYIASIVYIIFLILEKGVCGQGPQRPGISSALHRLYEAYVIMNTNDTTCFILIHTIVFEIRIITYLVPMMIEKVVKTKHDSVLNERLEQIYTKKF